MKTPVIIAAHNEASYIGRSLYSLNPQEVEPIVVDNGSDDNTAEIAEQFGATVFTRQEKGKLPAQQYALKALGRRALEPIIFLDADTCPVFRRHWVGSLIAPLMQDVPAVTAGLVGYRDGRIIDDTLRTARRLQASSRAYAENSVDALYGSNMAVALRTSGMLDKVLDMPHIWPGEDRALAQKVKDEGGNFYQSRDPRSLVLMSSRYNSPLIHRLFQKHTDALQVSYKHYRDRSAKGAVYSFYDGVYTPIVTEPDS